MRFWDLTKALWSSHKQALDVKIVKYLKNKVPTDIKAIRKCKMLQVCPNERVTQPDALQDPNLFYSVGFSTAGLSVITPVPPSPHYRIDLPFKETAAISPP